MALLDFFISFDLSKYYFPDWLLRLLETELFVIRGVVFDLWLLVHFLTGSLMGYSGAGLFITIVFFTGFELFENFLLVPRGLALSETLLNQAFDVIIGLIGWFVASRFTKQN